jgi:hypothetical protein
VIVVTPLPVAVTRPALVTVATPALALVHDVTSWSGITCCFWSRTTPLTVAVAPMLRRVSMAVTRMSVGRSFGSVVPQAEMLAAADTHRIAHVRRKVAGCKVALVMYLGATLAKDDRRVARIRLGAHDDQQDGLVRELWQSGAKSLPGQPVRQGRA